MSATQLLDPIKQTVEVDQSGGFRFDNCTRNVALGKMGMNPPRVRSTGTTIVAVTYKDGVLMGADSRATAGNIIADKDCMKVHKLTESIYACGAGTAADLDQVCQMLSANLRLLELNTERRARVISAIRLAKQHLFKYMGYVGAYLLVGGVDATGPHLYDVSANGTSMSKPYAASGSGSYAAVTVLERDYKFGIDEAEATALVQRALEAGMHGDNASGNSLNLVVITAKSTEFKGPIVPGFCVKPEQIELDYAFKPGTTTVLKRREIKYDVVEEMDVA